MSLEVGDLLVVQDQCKFKGAIESFHEKWDISPGPSTAMEMATAKAPPPSGSPSPWPATTPPSMWTATAMEMSTVMACAIVWAMKRKTGEKNKVKYSGYNFKPFDRIVGVVTEVIQEDHRDFDVIKIREQSGGTRYCRRYIIERAQEAT